MMVYFQVPRSVEGGIGWQLDLSPAIEAGAQGGAVNIDAVSIAPGADQPICRTRIRVHLPQDNVHVGTPAFTRGVMDAHHAIVVLVGNPKVSGLVRRQAA